MIRVRAVLMTSALALALSACRNEPAAEPPSDGYPGELVSTDAMGAAFLARQRVTATYGGKTRSFEAVLQLHGGTLTLIGMTPFGAKAFVLEQRGTDVKFTQHVDRELPFPPEYILLDIHRAMFMGLEGAPLPDGSHEGMRAGEVVVEEWREDRLLHRVFRRMDGEPAGEIHVRYADDGVAPGQVPGGFEFDNQWFGYSLTIKTLSSRMLR